MSKSQNSKKRKMRNMIVDGPFQLKVVLITVLIVLLQAVVTTGYFVISGMQFINDILPGLSTTAEITEAVKALLFQLLVAFTVANIDCLIVAAALSLYFSHKVSGPNYAIKRAINNLLDGVEHHTINLRKGDEFHDLADRINILFTGMKQRCETCGKAPEEQPDTCEICEKEK